MLNGSVPEKLQTFGKDSFLGNLLCGKPLNPCTKEGGANSGNGGRNSSVVDENNGFVRNKKKGKLSGGAIAGIVIGSVVLLLIVIFALIVLCRNRNGEKTSSVDEVATTLKHNQLIDDENVGHGNGNGNGFSSAAAMAAVAAAPVNGTERGGGEKKLVFFKNWSKVFDLEDLLRASAEVLGKGTFGTSYKAVLEAGPVAVAVKRLRDVTISEREFKEKIEKVGTMDHENLAPLGAYYYSRDEKLLVHDYLHMGSLSALLHGKGLLCFLFCLFMFL